MFSEAMPLNLAISLPSSWKSRVLLLSQLSSAIEARSYLIIHHLVKEVNCICSSDQYLTLLIFVRVKYLSCELECDKKGFSCPSLSPLQREELVVNSAVASNPSPFRTQVSWKP